VEEENKKKQGQASKGWTGWLWGSTQKEQTPTSEALFGGTMTEQQRNELYNVLNHDEKAALAEAIQPDSQALKTRILAKLRKGSFALRADSSPGAHDIVSVVFSVLQANVLQRAVNFEVSVSLGGFGVFDGTSHNSLHPQIVRVNGPSNDIPPGQTMDIANEDPFFYVKFERKPLDNRSETALTVCLRHTEVIYHRSYVEAIQRFFKPPASQLESVEALLVSQSVTWCRFLHLNSAMVECRQ
jgi:vacuolar protein sorting-associated protein 13A/C